MYFLIIWSLSRQMDLDSVCKCTCCLITNSALSFSMLKNADPSVWSIFVCRDCNQFHGCQVKEIWLHAHFLKMQNEVACDNCEMLIDSFAIVLSTIVREDSYSGYSWSLWPVVKCAAAGISSNIQIMWCRLLLPSAGNALATAAGLHLIRCCSAQDKNNWNICWYSSLYDNTDTSSVLFM